MVAIVLEVVGVVLNRPAGAIDARHSFVELGCTSLMAADVARRLSTALGLDVPPTLGFDYPTPASAGEHLWRLLEAPSAAQPRDAAGSKRAWVEAGKVSAVEPIAVVGVGVCLPGGVGSAGELWELLCRGGEGLGPFPRDRGWDVEGLFDPDPSVPGKSYVRLGHFVASAGHFDAGFFGISPREALAMDPQQRLVLQEAWHAFEDAGIDPGSLAGSDTGVFLGLMYQDYGWDHGHIPDLVDGHLGIGTAPSVASGRVAYSFGLQGPAVTVDTACSSGLVAVHQAVGALRSGECSLALAGGATVIANPHVFTEFSRQRGLAVDGRCNPVCQGAVGQPVGPVVWWLTGRESRWIGDDESGGSAGAVFAA